jgi:hypothetical protein
MSDNLDEPGGTAAPTVEGQPPDRSEISDESESEEARPSRWMTLGGIAAAVLVAAGAVVAGLSGGDDDSGDGESTTATSASPGTETTSRPPTDVIAPPGVDPDARPSDEAAPPQRDTAASEPSDVVIIPYLIGVDADTALAQLSAEGLDVQVAEQLVEDEGVADIVVDTVPAAGTELEPGSAIKVIVTRLAGPGGAG